MNFLVDNALSPFVAQELRRLGHDAVHVRDIGLSEAADDVIFSTAFQQGRTIISADTDFGTLLALQQMSKPSVILFRGDIARRPVDQVRLLEANMPSLREGLERGSVVVFDRGRLRMRSLPFGRDG